MVALAVPRRAVSLKCTEHALFRYCQRVLGADVSWLKTELEKDIGPLTSDGYYKLKSHDAYAVIRDGFVVTVMTEAQLKALRKRPLNLRFKEAKEDY